MKIILALDPSLEPEGVISRLPDYPWQPDTVIRVLSIVRQPAPSAAELWFDAGGDIRAVRKTRLELAEESAARVADWLRTRGCTAETMVIDGRPARVIVDTAKSWTADLIVLMPVGRKVVHWVCGSTCRAVINHAPCSVKIFRHPIPLNV